MEKSLIKQYGANIFLSKIYVNEITEESSTCDYQHTIDIVRGENYNGNGFNLMKVYTKGELKELQNDKWKISPIIRMPFCWGGYNDKIDVVDIHGETYTIDLNYPDKNSLFKKNGFAIDITAVFEKILLLKDFLDITHLQLNELLHDDYEKIAESYYRASSYTRSQKIDKIKSLCLKLKEHINDNFKYQDLYNLYTSKIIAIESLLDKKNKEVQ